MPLDIPVLLGTVREGRETAAVADYVVARIGQRKDWTTHLVDPRALPWAENLVEREWEMDPRPPSVARFVKDMAQADGFIIVTPEYNYGIPGALKNLLDHLYDEWNRKPFGMVTTGGMSGGLRAADQLRQVISGLGAVVVPKHVPVPHVDKAFDGDGPTEDEEGWAKRVDGFLDEVAWYAHALQRARQGEARQGEARQAAARSA